MLGQLIAWLIPSPLGKITSRVSPNRYATSLVSGSAMSVALAQAARPDPVAVGLRRTIAGAATGGSEADFGTGVPTAGRLVQDISSRALPPAMFTSNLGKPPSLAAYRGRPVVLRGFPWGRQQRGVPRLRRAELLEPLARTPAPRTLAAGFLSSHVGHSRLEDVFAGDD